jgi:protein TonB
VNFFNKNLKDRFLLFLSLSLAIHLAALLTIYTQARLSQKAPTQDYIEITFNPISTKDLKESKQQIVEQSENQFNDETPEETKYLSRYNQKVIKETRAQNHGDFKNTAYSGDNKSAKVAKAEKKRASKKADDGTLPSLSAFTPKPQFTPNYDNDSSSGSRGPASATNDHLKHLPVSIETMLNAREFVYYTYYQRVRQQIRQFWEPSIRAKVQKIFAQGRSIASTQDHITKVIVILNRAGSLINVQIIDGSGVRDLDDAAVDAFRAAEPFPNPPKGMIEPDGTIKIRWDFVLESA